MLAYVVSQGSYFGFQIFLKYTHQGEMLGAFVILIGLMSFAFQFADFGNQSILFGSRYKSLIDVFDFVLARSIIAFITISVFSYWSSLSLGHRDFGGWIYSVPFAAALASMAPNFFNERNGNYEKISWLQMNLWLVLIFFCILIVYSDGGLLHLIVSLLFVFIFGLYLISWRVDLGVAKTQLKYKVAILDALGVVLGPVLAQAWGRAVPLLLVGALGLVDLGDISIFKSLQVAGSMFLGFVLRPKLRDFFLHLKSENRKRNLFLDFFKSNFDVYGVALFFPLASIILIYFGAHESVPFEINLKFSAVFWIIPFWLVSNTITQFNQMDLGPGRLMLIDLVCIFFNALVFVVLLKINPFFAMVMGEITHACVNSIFYFIRFRVSN